MHNPSYHGLVRIYGWSVDAAMPIIALRLVENDQVRLNFNQADNRLFAENPFYAARIDYGESTHNIEAYTTADQQRLEKLLGTMRTQLENAE